MRLLVAVSVVCIFMHLGINELKEVAILFGIGVSFCAAQDLGEIFEGWRKKVGK